MNIVPSYCKLLTVLKDRIFFLFLPILLVISVQANAQTKYEKESRIKPTNVPETALAFVASLNTESKVKWYLDIGFSESTVEAKFKINSQRYSVEFDTSGQLIDVEIEIPLHEIPLDVRNAIASRLNTDCKKYSIKKTQVQYSGDEASVRKTLQESATSESSVRYELVVKCKKEEGTDLYEYLFDSNGRFLSVAKIVFSNASNIEY